MTEPPRTEDESRRLLSVRGSQLLDTPEEARFDRITRTAAALFEAPIALVSLVDAERQWFKSHHGLEARETPRDLSFCAHAILQPGVMVVPDATQDPRFADNALVTGPPGIRFYAGQPVRSSGGSPLGTLCVIDRVPRTFSATQQTQLQDLGTWVEDQLASATDDALAHRFKDSRSRFWAVMNSLAEAVVTFGDDGLIRFANDRAEELFGAAAGELVDTHIEERVGKPTWTQILALVDGRSVDDGGPRQRRPLQVSCRRLDGTPVPVELAISETLIESERLFVATGQDITERLAVGHASRSTERHFRAIFDNAAVGIAYSDLDGPTIIDVNAAFADMVGYSIEELRGGNFEKLVHPDDVEVDERMFERTREGAVGRLQREQRYLKRDGTVMWGQLTLSIVDDEDGHPRFAIGIFEDITERHETERIKDEFVSVVGHELRTPLTSIRGSLGLLEAGVLGELPEEAASMVSIAVSNAERLVRLINDMLDIERMDAGRAEFIRRPVTALALVTAALQVVQATADKLEVTLATEVDDESVMADADRIVQALTNLLGNAIKFSPAGEAVTVSVSQDGAEVCFTVRDQGRGIPDAELEAVFDRFHQVDLSDAREKSGTGLGLAIARGIVEHHGGRIWAESLPGVGAALHFTLPILSPGLTLLVSREAADPDDDRQLATLGELGPALRPRDVLIVEDDAILAAVLARTLSAEGAEPRIAGTADEAVRAIRESPPAVLVLDLMLPGADGFSIVERLRGAGILGEVPVLVYTALDLKAGDRERLQLGRTEFFTKAADTPHDLERRVAELLASPETATP